MTTHIMRKHDDNSVAVFYNDEPAGLLQALVIRPGNDKHFNPWVCQIVSIETDANGTTVIWRREDEDVNAVLNLNSHPDGYTGEFRVSGTGHCIVKLVWSLPVDERGFPFMPAFMYGCNEGGNSPWAMYPQLDNGSNGGNTKPWVAREWYVRADRSSHGLTSVITDRLFYAIGGRDVSRYSYNKIACKNGLAISSTDPHKLTFSVGYANWPFTYSVNPGRNFALPEAFVNLSAGEVITPIFLLFGSHENRQDAASRILRESYLLLHDRVNDAGSVEDGIRAVSDALVDYGYSIKAKNFYVTLSDDPRIAETSTQFNSAWAGGLRTGYPLLIAGHQLKNKKWLECARSLFDDMATNGICEKTNMFFENYNVSNDEWSTRGWWYGAMENPGHSGYVNGQVCHYMLLAYIADKEAGMDHPDWLTSSKRVLDHIANVQADDGRFGFSYSEEDGSIADGVGFSSCWFTPAFATLHKITGDAKYLNTARKAMDFYRQDVEAFNVYGGPHDIPKSPDEEGILAWIDAARILHESTGEERFLKDLLIGLDYEFSWRFAFNVVNEMEPLKSMNWCSTGGSVTSVNNSHVHPMGSAITDSILYALEATGDPYLKSRLIDTIRWTLTTYLHYDGDYGWGKKGMINERFCYTDSLILERFPNGTPASTWFCAHSWASGAILEGLVGKLFEAVREGRFSIEE